MKAGRSRNIPAFAAPVLVAGARGAVWLGVDGAAEALDHAAAAGRAQAGPPPVVCHGPVTARKLKGPPFAALDALELFAFVRPAAFCLPTPRGLAAAQLASAQWKVSNYLARYSSASLWSSSVGVSPSWTTTR